MSIGRVPGATGIQPSIVDAKGDLIVATAADSVSRLAVGTNGQYLKADSAQSTGLIWSTLVDGDWTFGTWSPTYANLTVGNGTVIARYAQKGKLVVAWWKFEMGSTSSITGGITVSVPVTPYAATCYTAIVEGQAGNNNVIMSTTAANDRWYIRAIDTSTTYAKIAVTSSTIPGTWSSAPGDFIGFTSVYEAA